ncbi:quinolinate synthase NadA [Candidatus Peregrinibacteria bacterium]|nr:quinolinate synthase NadA [Candidatus Peregrinibacteria bacterium]
MSEQKKIVKEINRIKKQKNAVILVHNYQRPEIYEVADFIGDSLDLCIKSAQTDAKMIIFCGVSFMAQSAAILNPGKKVIMPNMDAGCAMADMIEPEGLKKHKKKYPDAKVVCYVNSTAEIKALSDACCTSANAVKVVSSFPEKKIIFVPDKNLADYVQAELPEKEIIPWNGYCPIHSVIDDEYVQEMKKQYPKAKIIAHPESKPEILKIADHIASTSGMIECAKKDFADEFFVLTECGMINRLHKEIPKKKFYGLCNMCFDMKKNTLESILIALKEGKPIIKIDREIAKKALKAFEKMFAVTK